MICKYMYTSTCTILTINLITNHNNCTILTDMNIIGTTSIMNYFILTEYNSDQWTVNGFWNSTNKQELIERRKKIIPVKPLQHNNEENREMIQEIAQLKQQLREKDTTIQQKEATIQQKDTVIHQQANDLQDQLREKEDVIQQKDDTIRDKDTTIRQKQATIQEKTTALDQSINLIQEKDDTIQQKDITIRQQQQQTNEQLRQKDTVIQEKEDAVCLQEEQVNELHDQLREKQATIQEKEAANRRKDAIIQQKEDDIRQKEDTIRDKDTTIRQKQATIQEKTTALDQSDNLIQEKDDTIQRNDATIAEQQRVIQRCRDNPHWVIQRDEVTITQNTLGRGGWGEVKVGIFRGTKVAVKRLYQEIQSELYMDLFAREMNIASRIRHPNLLQFIGATREGDLLIVTELMPTSLRDELGKNKLAHSQVIAIAIDIITGLNYLHMWRPQSIIHRDVSSANVLLQPILVGQWKAKLSDYGSVNLQDHIKTANPGNPIYSAPESNTPALHSPAMDIFSFGILFAEMATRRLPSSTVYEREAQIRVVKWPTIRSLITRCTVTNHNTRPKTDNVLNQLEELYRSEFN